MSKKGAGFPWDRQSSAERMMRTRDGLALDEVNSSEAQVQIDSAPGTEEHKDLFGCLNIHRHRRIREIVHQLSTQVQANAVVCDVKATRSLLALRLITVFLILYVIRFVPFGGACASLGDKAHRLESLVYQQAPIRPVLKVLSGSKPETKTK